jgi:hypothetical protein
MLEALVFLGENSQASSVGLAKMVEFCFSLQDCWVPVHLRLFHYLPYLFVVLESSGELLSGWRLHSLDVPLQTNSNGTRA